MKKIITFEEEEYNKIREQLAEFKDDIWDIPDLAHRSIMFENLNKLEESMEPVIGDVVKIIDKQRQNECYRGLYLGTNGVEYFVQITGDHYPTPFTVKHCDIKKTGKRVNLNYESEV